MSWDADIVYCAGQAVMFRLLGVVGLLVIEEEDGEICLTHPAYPFLDDAAREEIGSAVAEVTGRDDAEVLWRRLQVVDEIASKYIPTAADRLVSAAGVAACQLAVEQGVLPASSRIPLEPPAEAGDVARALDILSRLWPEVEGLVRRVQEAVADGACVVLEGADLPTADLRRVYQECGGATLDDVWLPLDEEVGHARC